MNNSLCARTIIRDALISQGLHEDSATLTNKAKMLSVVCTYIDDNWSDSEWGRISQSVGMKTTSQIQKAIENYTEPFRAIPDISKGSLVVIKELLAETNYRTREEALEIVCSGLERRFKGDDLEYYLRQMRLNSTDAVAYAIELYHAHSGLSISSA